VATGPDPLTKRDAIVIGGLVIVSVTAQALAAAYFEMTGSLLALGGSALAFLIWVFVRFRPRT
jgi:hypothetical protein